MSWQNTQVQEVQYIDVGEAHVTVTHTRRDRHAPSDETEGLSSIRPPHPAASDLASESGQKEADRDTQRLATDSKAGRSWLAQRRNFRGKFPASFYVNKIKIKTPPKKNDKAVINDRFFPRSFVVKDSCPKWLCQKVVPRN